MLVLDVSLSQSVDRAMMIEANEKSCVSAAMLVKRDFSPA